MNADPKEDDKMMRHMMAGAMVLGLASQSQALMTRWAGEVSPSNALPEYPRPQMVRPDWQNLNGLWDYALAPAAAKQPKTWAGQILVPYPFESALSGVMGKIDEKSRLWYRRDLKVPAGWAGKRVILHFGAVTRETSAWVNGKLVGRHKGGYDAFSFDITDALKDGEGVLVVAAYNQGSAAKYPQGKQSFKPEGIFYTPASGIWQTVWLEPRPKNGITRLKLTPDLGSKTLKLKVSAGPGLSVEAVAFDQSKPVAKVSGIAGSELSLEIPKPKTWSPDSPFLYDLKVTVSKDGQPLDEVASYFGMRSVAKGKDAKGVLRPLLNGKFKFETGVLDQGYWPDGIYTAPTDAALRYDLEMTRKFNLIVNRKHMKVEPARWYYWADRLGVLVHQDMPTGRFERDDVMSPEARTQFEKEFQAMLDGLHNHPCITEWTVFNEGWYQYDTERLTAWVQSYDPSRLANNASGWVDKKVGDVADMHMYPGPGSPEPEESRIAALGEFGGLSMPLPEAHSFKGGGYENILDQAEFDIRYKEVWQKVWELKEKPGLSRAIYTQLTDVETETNGLMSYDREVFRPTFKTAADAHIGKIDLPRQKTVLATSADSPQTWRYTFQAPPAGWEKPGFDDSGWQQGEGAFGTPGTPNARIRTTWDNKEIWIRRHFELAKAKLNKPSLFVYHDEDFEAFLNGVPAATGAGYTTNYKRFKLPAPAIKALKPGQNTLAIHCRQTGGGQAIDAGLVEEK